MLEFSRATTNFLVKIAYPQSSQLAALPVDDDRLAAAVSSTCFIYPAIIHDSEDVSELVETMTCARKDNSGRFVAHVALVDFADASDQYCDSDVRLRAEIDARLAMLNEDYGKSRMLAFYRCRTWNPVEAIWMGWERKRGKLVEFARLVADANVTSFSIESIAERAAVTLLRQVHFAVTLDLGSRLLNNGAARLVATIAHPQNRAKFNSGRRVIGGFGFFRPEHVGMRPTNIFEWIHYHAGVEAGAFSVERQVFDREPFFGQGILDTSAYLFALEGQIPDNTVLSHDKLEGLLSRAACVRDAILLDVSPQNYMVFGRREHRWVRGDTHLLPWIFCGRRGGRRMTLSERWLLLNDILGHLCPVSAVLVLVASWLTLPVNLIVDTSLGILVTIVEPTVSKPIVSILRPTMPADSRRTEDVVFRSPSRWRLAGSILIAELSFCIFAMFLLADRAMINAHAIVQALYRTFVSHKHVLEWISFSQEAQGKLMMRSGISWWERLKSPVLATFLMAFIIVVRPHALPSALLLLLLWLVSPLCVLVTAWQVPRRFSVVPSRSQGPGKVV